MFKLDTKEQKFSLDKLSPITISGFSRSALRTGFLLKPYNIYLDAGIHPSKESNLVLLSHSHYDHIACIYPILLESKNTNVMLPANTVDDLSKLLNTLSSLNSGKKSSFKWNPITDSNYTCIINSKRIFIETHRLTHSVDSIGFGINEIKNSLKSEFKDLSSKEIAILKKNGIEITEKIVVPILLFISDTSSAVLPNLPFYNYKLIIIECTFIEDEHYQEAINRKHIHWNDLKTYISKYSNSQFILTHFSSRYKDEYLIEKEIELKEEYPNIIFWI